MKVQLKTQSPKILLGVLYVAALVFYAGLLLSNSQRIHEPRMFGDSEEYLRMAQLPVLSASSWIQMKPPVTSFFYKLNGADPNRIFTFQLWFSIVCWTVLALAVSFAVRSYYLKPLAFALILAFSLSRDVFMWIPFIGSEAVSFSLFALFIAAAIWLLAEWKAYKIPFLVAAAFLMVFSRDTAAAFLLMASAMLLTLLWFSAHRWHMLAISASFLAIAATSMLAGNVAGRFGIVFPIITSLRIFPNPEYVAFFKAQGMPVNQALVERSDPNSPGYAKWDVALALWGDPSEAEYRRWIKDDGAASYLKFLWFFKADTLQRMFIENGGRDVFYPDVYYYTATGYRPILSDQRLAEMLYPTRFGLAFFFFANTAAAFALGVALCLKRSLWLVPIVMILGTYPQAFLVWNMDANDIPRHSVSHNITERLGVWILALFAIDFLSQWARPAIQRVWEKVGLRLKIGFGANSHAESGG